MILYTYFYFCKIIYNRGAAQAKTESELEHTNSRGSYENIDTNRNNNPLDSSSSSSGDWDDTRNRNIRSSSPRL